MPESESDTPREYEADVHELFGRALDLPPEDREAFIARACPDEGIGMELRRLLRHDVDGDDPFLGGSVLAGGHQQEGGVTPERIGPYRIIREIGRGGTGVVFEAEQESPRRRVAVKILRNGLVDRGAAARFQAEAHLLAQLRHVGIAHVYESGEACVGNESLPYFAMEYIEGRPIDVFAEEESLSLRQRLELVARVCDAVQHAHLRGIIHRDLKPANILVASETSTQVSHEDSRAVVDNIGQPKILDFGIARVTDADLQIATIETRAGQIVGTLGYMSPAQVEGRSEAVDTRCDVYALGVILYRLVGGRMPLDLSGLSIAEAARRVRDGEPPRLGSIDPALRGDIELIAAEALEKDPERRYASPAHLASDIRRFLTDEPIEARAPTAIYQLRKFARRNRALVLGAGATALALFGGLAASIVLLIATAQERNAKEAALQDSEDILTFMTDTLKVSMPESLGRNVTVPKMLEMASEEIPRQFGDRPRIAARTHRTFGDILVSHGEFDRADEQLSAAVRIWEADERAPLKDVAETMAMLGWAHLYRGDAPRALEAGERAVALLGTSPDPPVLVHAVTAQSRALIQLGRFDEAEASLQQAIDQLSARNAGRNVEQDPDLEEQLIVLSENLASSYVAQNDPRAEVLYRDVIRRASRAFGERSPKLLTYKGNLAGYYRNVGRNHDAIPLLREVLVAQRELLGGEHRQTLISANNLAQVLAGVGEVDEALALLQAALETAIAVHGELSDPVLFLNHTLGGVQRRAGSFEKAERTMIRTLELYRETRGEDSSEVRFATSALMNLYTAFNHEERAIEIGEALLARLTGRLEPRHIWVYQTRYDLARAYVAAGRLDEGERAFLDVLQVADPVWAGAASRRVLALYRQSGQLDKAEAMLRRSLEEAETELGRDAPGVLSVQWQLGQLLLDVRREEGLDLLRDAARRARDTLGPDHELTIQLESQLGALDADA